MIRKPALLLALILSCVLFSVAQKPKLTLDEFFNAVSFRSVEVSRDGNSVVIATERAGLGSANLPRRSMAVPR